MKNFSSNAIASILKFIGSSDKHQDEWKVYVCTSSWGMYHSESVIVAKFCDIMDKETFVGTENTEVNTRRK